jgi:hypothetical protein
MRNYTGHGKVICGLAHTALAVACQRHTAIKLWVLLLLLAILPNGASAHIIQQKECLHLVCSLDNPVKDGDLLIVIGIGGCAPQSALASERSCNSVSDDLANVWQIAEIVPNNLGTILWYAINARGGTDTIYRSVGFSGTIVAEYPPALGLDDSNQGTYTFENHGDAPQGASSDIGHTEVIEVSRPNELVITWATAGDLGYKYSAGPYFTMQGATPDGAVGFEDMIAGQPGLYMGTMGWDTYAHWTMGVAAFRMGTIAVQNPSFEEMSAPLLPSNIGPWNDGPLPGWSQWGNIGLWQPLAANITVPDRRTIVWSDGGGIYQDLGETSAKTYQLSASFGNRSGSAIWTMSLNAGATVLCTTSGSLSSILVGSFTTETLPCNVPAGDLTIVLAIQGQGQGMVDDVILSTMEPDADRQNQRRSSHRAAPKLL